MYYSEGYDKSAWDNGRIEHRKKESQLNTYFIPSNKDKNTCLQKTKVVD